MSSIPLRLAWLTLLACGEPDLRTTRPADDDTSGSAETGSDTASTADPVRINEIMFEPRRSEPREKFDGANRGTYTEIDDDGALEYIELYNAGEDAVDLTAWAFTEGIRFEFPAGTGLETGGYVVVAADPGTFAAYHGLAALGPFEGGAQERRRAAGPHRRGG